MKLIAKFQQLYQLQKTRYQRKGLLNILIAVTLLVTILKTANLICHAVWPTHVQNKQLFVVGISCIIHFFFQISYFFIYAPGYFGIAHWYQKYRINKGVKRPWDHPDWPKTRKRLFYYLGLNYCLMYPGMIIISTKLSGIKVRFEDLPTTWELAWQLLFVSIWEDCFFYWAHKLSHDYKFLYKYHKIHHEYTQIFSLVTEYTHPIDYVLGILIPSALPFIFLGGRAHCFMFFFWQVWKIYVSTEGHCGYYFPWSPTRIFLCVSDPSFHDFHHSKNIGNFAGSIYLWDFFKDTGSTYFDIWKKSPQTFGVKPLKQ